jgi:hypothetical protein
LEKEAKTFAHWGARWIHRAPHVSKAFLVLFFKKELLALALPESLSMQVVIRLKPL